MPSNGSRPTALPLAAAKPPGKVPNAIRIPRSSSAASKRPPLAERDSRFALDYVKRNARTPDEQQLVLAALEFKCGVLWAMLDALYHAYVAPGHIPPGAFVPKEQP